MIKLGGKYDGQMWVGDPTTSRSLETELVSQTAQSPGIWMENYRGLLNTLEIHITGSEQ